MRYYNISLSNEPFTPPRDVRRGPLCSTDAILPALRDELYLQAEPLTAAPEHSASETAAD